MYVCRIIIKIANFLSLVIVISQVAEVITMVVKIISIQQNAQRQCMFSENQSAKLSSSHSQNITQQIA